jgi:hypothetical protein
LPITRKEYIKAVTIANGNTTPPRRVIRWAFWRVTGVEMKGRCKVSGSRFRGEKVRVRCQKRQVHGTKDQMADIGTPRIPPWRETLKL